MMKEQGRSVNSDDPKSQNTLDKKCAVSHQAQQNLTAQKQAFELAVPLGNLIPTTVSYESHGYGLIIGEADQLIDFIKIPSNIGFDKIVFLCTHVLSADIKSQLQALQCPLVQADQIDIQGYLGEFDVQIQSGQISLSKQSPSNINAEAISLSQVTLNRRFFDIVVDLTLEGCHKAQLPPLGYYAVGRLDYSKADAIEALENMLGIFDKPKYFKFDQDRCAHYANGKQGCTRCMDACAADAIYVERERIAINPFLCQGQGSCATACPTEAIRYDLPDPISTHNYLKQILDGYFSAGGESPCILFYAAETESMLGQMELPSNVLPIQLEELASVGIDAWFLALAYGAAQIYLFAELLHEKTQTILNLELNQAHCFLTALELDTQRIQLRNAKQLVAASFDWTTIIQHPTEITGSKRERLTSALDVLAKQRIATGLDAQKLTITSVPLNAPYGSIQIQESDCTLCLSCVSACPTQALQSIGTSPGITFREQDCVQCGLCEVNCPESVITLQPQYNWQIEARQTPRILHQEPAAECIRCGKAYAPISMVNMLIERLSSHSHYQAEAIKRLSMCEDCRVRDIVEDAIVKNPEKQLKL